MVFCLFSFGQLTITDEDFEYHGENFIFNKKNEQKCLDFFECTDNSQNSSGTDGDMWGIEIDSARGKLKVAHYFKGTDGSIHSGGYLMKITSFEYVSGWSVLKIVCSPNGYAGEESEEVFRIETNNKWALQYSSAIDLGNVVSWERKSYSNE